MAKSLSGQALNNELYVGANVQEESGTSWSSPSTTKFDPEIFLAVDCSPAADVFGDQGAIGEGTLLRFYDPGHIMLPNMKDFLLTTAEEAGIKFQYYCAKGGTDAGAAHLKNGESHQQPLVSVHVTSTLTKPSMPWMISCKHKPSYKRWLRNWIALQLI